MAKKNAKLEIQPERPVKWDCGEKPLYPEDLPLHSFVEDALGWDTDVEIEGENRDEFNARRAILAAAYLLRFDTQGGESMPSSEVVEAVARVLDSAAFVLRGCSHDRQLANLRPSRRSASR